MIISVSIILFILQRKDVTWIWPSWLKLVYFYCSPEYKTVINQSGHTLHHHTASCQAHWQPHYKQSHSEDWWPQTHKNGAHHQPLLQQQDCTGYCGAEEQVSFNKEMLLFLLTFQLSRWYLLNDFGCIMQRLHGGLLQHFHCHSLDCVKSRNCLFFLGLLGGTKLRKFSWPQDKQKWRLTFPCQS